MNKDQAADFMARVSAAYGRGFKADTTAEWTRQLGPIDAHRADMALDRIIQAGEQGPSIARIISETRPATVSVPPPREVRPLGAPGCHECDASGFSGFEDHYGNLRMAPCASCRPDDRAKCDLNYDFGPPIQFAAKPSGQIHDFAAHERDRAIADSWPTCNRCIEMCVDFHDVHGIGHLVPSALRQRRSDLAARQPVPQEN